MRVCAVKLSWPIFSPACAMLVCSKRKQGHYAERITDIPCPDSGFLRFDWSPLPLIMLYTSVYVSFFFFKLYFIDYAITVFPNFPPLSPSTPSGNPHTTVHVHGSCIYVLWLLRFLYCILYLHGYSVTNYLYFLTPSPLHLFPTSPSHLATIRTLSVSMILSLFLFA